MGQNAGRQALRGLASTPDELREGWHRGLPGDTEAAAEIVPERNTQFTTGLGEPEEGITTVASDIAAGATADLSLGDLAPDIAFGIVGMQRDVGMIERGEQFGLIGVQALQ